MNASCRGDVSPLTPDPSLHCDEREGNRVRGAAMEAALITTSIRITRACLQNHNHRRMPAMMSRAW